LQGRQVAALDCLETPIMFPLRSLTGSLTLAVLLTVIAAADDSPAIPPAEAQNHVGQSVTVEMVVKAAKKSCKRKLVFLDSLEDFQDPDNLGISIDEAGEQDLARKFANTDLPAFFLNKTIRVTGAVARRDDRTYLDVSQATQIELSATQQ
jgi:hypothetical protein